MYFDGQVFAFTSYNYSRLLLLEKLYYFTEYRYVIFGSYILSSDDDISIKCHFKIHNYNLYNPLFLQDKSNIF